MRISDWSSACALPISEINDAVESNPLLDWDESEPLRATDGSGEAKDADEGESKDAEFREDDWSPAGEAWQESRGWSGDDDGDAAERMVQTDSLQDHLSWQLHLTQMSDRDHRTGLMLIDAIDDEGYLRESTDVIAQSLLHEIRCSADEVLPVLHQVQRLDPGGVAIGRESCRGRVSQYVWSSGVAATKKKN